MNRLAQESSPYLLQHKDNPVDWYPWCAEALLRARAEDKPIFLSVGYSACHWCHVMEHESFENPQIADYLNRHFISIKVDREERPDLDQIYMQAVMAMNGHGGWPLSAFLTPDQDFFFGGTYWPPTANHQMPGFDQVLGSVLDAWHQKREQVVEQSKQITTMIASTTDRQSLDDFDRGVFQAAVQVLHNQFDSTFGGFGTAPKFPHPMDLLLLLRMYERQTQDTKHVWDAPQTAEVLQMVEVTLKRMAYGGIFDHLAGGFSRYSVDARWLVPHFEKMLYDNAQLARAFVHTWRLTNNAFYSRMCEKTLDYLLAYLRDSGGGFHSTEDADSEGEEGKFYVWTPEEVKDVLGEHAGTRFCQLYDVTPAGNFEGRNIINLPLSFADFAERHQLDKTTLMTEMRDSRKKLLEVRDRRIRPGLDDKVLTSWNGLAIEAFADAAVLLERADYAEAAQQAGDFIWHNMRQEDGRLLHSSRHGQASLTAYLDDYACLINAFVSLYRVAFDGKWINRAVALSELMKRHFYNTENNAFYFTADDHEKLVARTQDFQDSAVPSGNAMAATALIRLGQMTGDAEMVEVGMGAALGAVPLLNRAANAASQSLLAIDTGLHTVQTYVLVQGADDIANQRVLDRLKKQAPWEAAWVVVSGTFEAANTPFAVILEGKVSLDEQPTLYVCRNFHCELPVSGEASIASALASLE